jgi:hypothetical protein
MRPEVAGFGRPSTSFNQKLPVVKFSDWWKGPATDMRPVVSVLFRAALDDPAIQQKWDSQYGNVDWRQAKQEDAKPSGTLRGIIAELRSAASGLR